MRFCPCGSVVEHSLGKGEVAGPIPAMGTSNFLNVLRHTVVSVFFGVEKWQKVNLNAPSLT